MAHETDIIHIADDSELAKLLDRTDSGPIRVEKNGVVYRVSREGDVWAGYDPAKVRAAVRAAAGALTEEEAEKMKEYIYRAREEGSRPADRP